MKNQQTPHKNKALAALLAALGGTFGLYRFYLAGPRDRWAWLHCAALPLSLLLYLLFSSMHPFFAAMPLILSALAGLLACLVIGTTTDEQWDARFNPGTPIPTQSGWLLVLTLIFALAIGAGLLILVIARSFDLMLTGGLYG